MKDAWKIIDCPDDLDVSHRGLYNRITMLGTMIILFILVFLVRLIYQLVHPK